MIGGAQIITEEIMTVRFVEDKCEERGQHMFVVIEADGPAELTSLSAREQVLVFARRKGFPARGLNGLPQSYPVDAKGETGEDVLMGRVPVAAHRAEYQVNAGAGVF
jgi:hypothetical protein